MNSALEDTFNATASVIQQQVGQEVFPFLKLPSELRNEVYRALLVHHEPIGLKFDPLGEKFETYFGMFPEICRTSKSVAFESFAILYGENTFRFAAFLDLYLPYCSFGTLRRNSERWDSTDLKGINYSYFFTTIMVDTFSPYGHVDGGFYECSMYSPNLKKLLLKLPEGLRTLTIESKKRLLLLKADAPKHAAVEFCGATPDIVAEVTDAWYNYIPENEEEDEPIHFVDGPEWFMKQVKTHGGEIYLRPRKSFPRRRPMPLLVLPPLPTLQLLRRPAA